MKFLKLILLAALTLVGVVKANDAQAIRTSSGHAAAADGPLTDDSSECL